MRANRLSEIEALRRLTDYKEQAAKGFSDDIPDDIKEKLEILLFFNC